MDELKFQHYLVVFLDHLGQREKLREIKSIPTCDEEKDKFISSIRETLGKVMSTRDIFKNFYDSFNNFAPSSNLIPEQFHILVPNMKSEVFFYGISDSIVIAVPLMNKNENANAVRGIYSVFCAASSSALLSLSAKMVIRGGLDVGIATQVDNKEIYGPALERAYYIESQISEYPRFVAGNELITYLEWIESQQHSSLSGRMSKALARSCRKMLFVDHDGYYMLDFLGAEVKNAMGVSIDPSIITNAYNFVKDQYCNYSNRKEYRIASRYYRLMKYFDSRLSVWGI